MAKIHIIGTVVTALVLLIGAVTFFVVTNTEHTIVLTDDGFSPQELSIGVGETVHFVNKRTEPFWPASNLHPTHTIYPDFDPKEPLPAGASWSFTFLKSGTWSYHDHINPLFEGAINVQEGARDAATKIISPDCSGYETDPERITCWDEAIKDAFDAGGLKRAFDLYEILFKDEPVFARDCHSFTHTIGKKSFEEYLATNDIDVTSQIGYCSYGYFHGFMEALVHYNGDYKGARDFCDLVDGKIGKETHVYTACLHGIGHGVTDGYDPTKTDALAIITPGIDLCRGIGRTPYEVKICATGVFNSLAGMYETGAVPFDPENPLAVCYNFVSEKDIQSACFDDMKTLLSSITGHDLVESAKFIEAITDDELAIAAIDNLATYHVYWLLENGFEEGVKDCYRIEDRLQAGCVRGISVGFMGQGEPGEEYKEAIRTCQSALVKDEHRQECFDRTMIFAQERYTKEKHSSICESISDVYKGEGCTTYRGEQLF